MGTTTEPRADVYQRITDTIIAQLENGVRPWSQPWAADKAGGSIALPLRSNGLAYRGINVLALWCASMAKGYQARHWFTFKQAIDLGGNVRKGEKASLVVFANSITRTETGADGSEEERCIPFLKGYSVFNAEQCENLPARFYARSEPNRATGERIALADAFFAATGADIRHGGARAFYSPSTDHVQMPPFETFHEAEGYASVLAHECVHWTSAPKRCGRELGKRFGDAAYAAEELIAEMGAAFLCADLGIANEPRDDHASYIASWLRTLRNDKRAVFTAASAAQKAVDYLHSLQPAVEKEKLAA